MTEMATPDPSNTVWTDIDALLQDVPGPEPLDRRQMMDESRARNAEGAKFSQAHPNMLTFYGPNGWEVVPDNDYEAFVKDHPPTPQQRAFLAVQSLEHYLECVTRTPEGRAKPDHIASFQETLREMAAMDVEHLREAMEWVYWGLDDDGRVISPFADGVEAMREAAFQGTDVLGAFLDATEGR